MRDARSYRYVTSLECDRFRYGCGRKHVTRFCDTQGEHEQTKVAEAEEADSEDAVPEEADE